MKKFEFSLQSLLDAQEAKERATEQKLGAHLRILEELRRIRRCITASIEEAIRNFEHLNGRPQEHLLHTAFMAKLRQDLVLQSEKTAAAEAAVETVRKALHAIIRERKGLEKLKERELLRWQEEWRHQEQKAMDEVASTGYVRRMRNSL